MSANRLARLQHRTRGRRQLAVGTAGLAALSVGGVGVVAATAAHHEQEAKQQAASSVTSDESSGTASNGFAPSRRFDHSFGGNGFVGPTGQPPVAHSHGS